MKPELKQEPADKLEVRLLPLVPNSPNEGLANTLARLLVEDESQAEMGARSAILILSGIQAFYDSGGNYRVVESLWEPIIIARQMEKTYGDDAWKHAADNAAAMRALEDHRGAEVYERAAMLLQPDIKSSVDNPS